MSNIKIADLDPGDDCFKDLQQSESNRIYGGFSGTTFYLTDVDLSFLEIDWNGGPIIINDRGVTVDGVFYSKTSLFMSKRSHG